MKPTRRIAMMLRLILALLLMAPLPALAQSVVRSEALIVSVCGTAPNSGYVVGTFQPVTMDRNGQLCPGTGGIAPVVDGSAASSQVLKASPGNLYSMYATVTAASWLMVFNSTTAPSNGSTTAGVASGNLQDCFSIPSGSASINYAPGPPEVFSTGITAVISSTACGTLTLATTGYIHGSVQ
jgi:hypothetical protein